MASTLGSDAACAAAGKRTSVTLCQAAAPYQTTLPAALARAGMLHRLVRVGPELQIFEPGEAASLKLVKQFPLYRVFSRWLWSAWGLTAGEGRPRLPIVATSWLAAHLAARWLPATGIFHALPGLALPSLQQPGMMFKSVLENATLHPRTWQREVLYECARACISPRACSSTLPSRLIRRMEQEYELCDAIIVPSTTARRTFAEFGLAQKTHVVWPGVDSDFFAPTSSLPPPPIFRACFVGRIELAKGTLYLLEAWKQLGLPGAELVLVGSVQPDIRSILNRYAGSNVIFTGALSRRGVADRYRSASVFIHPSPNEGLGLVLLEAMACGVPVIATDRSGAEDCVTHGKDGFVIPARDVRELAEAISWCFRHRGELPAMGLAARHKVAQRFTLTHYEQRQLAFYRSLAAGAVPSSATQPSAALS
jgi:glycosyltransferase involved in cell wall biosynthesis